MTNNKKLLAGLNAQLKALQTELVEANKREGKDAYIDVKLGKKQVRADAVRKKDQEDKLYARFYFEIDITAKVSDVLIPLSVATGKRTAGFMYYTEGTTTLPAAETELKVRGEGVTQLKVGTLLFAKVPTGKTAKFVIQANIQGKQKEQYQFIISRISYKLSLDEVRYLQYMKEIKSGSVTLS